MSADTSLIINEFLQVLSHKIRTPLSVIANDLQYLQKIYPDSQSERPLRNAGIISEIFSKLEDQSNCIAEAANLFVREQKLEPIFLAISKIMCSEDNWQISKQTLDNLILTYSFQSVNLKVSGISDLYKNHLKKELPGIYLIDAALGGLGINQKVWAEDETVYFSLSKDF